MERLSTSHCEYVNKFCLSFLRVLLVCSAHFSPLTFFFFSWGSFSAPHRYQGVFHWCESLRTAFFPSKCSLCGSHCLTYYFDQRRPFHSPFLKTLSKILRSFGQVILLFLSYSLDTEHVNMEPLSCGARGGKGAWGFWKGCSVGRVRGDDTNRPIPLESPPILHSRLPVSEERGFK